jgi:glycerophosphoryl diester phosphodiesterase
MAPLIIAHRGGSPDLGENTVAAFEAGLRSGADMLEMDVQRSADGHLVVLHDEDMLLPDGTREPTAKLTLAQLQALAPRLMLFDEFLDRFLPHKATNVDIKTPGYEAEVVRRLRRHDLIQNVVVSSTYWRSLRRIKLLAPDLRCGLSRGQIVTWLGKEPHSTIAAWGMRSMLTAQLEIHSRYALADAVMLQHRIVRPWLVRWLSARGLDVYAWTVNDPDEAVRLASARVTGIATDYPELILEALKGHGKR